MHIFVTGGAGYIGSHTVLCLLEAGHQVTVYDNFDNGHRAAIDRVSKITGKPCTVIQADILDVDRLKSHMRAVAPDAVIHFAGLKAVGESVADPVRYYQTNVGGSLNVLCAMDDAGVKTIVFSSSATVYDATHAPPFEETHALAPTNPYGHSKRMVEQMLSDWAQVSADRRAIALRYFNPVGAHPSGEIGEDPAGIPNNLMPFIAQVAVGRRPRVQVFGDDYATRDGTGERDYIHVMDLAEAHVTAAAAAQGGSGYDVFNIGTGHGITVLEMIAAYAGASGVEIPYDVAPRRAGDVAQSWADTTRAHKVLGWRAQRGLEDMVRSSWAWQTKNPNGYAD